MFSKGFFVKVVKGRDCVLTLHHIIPTLNDLEKEAFENIVGKGENANYQHFLLFPQCFLPFPKVNFNFSVIFIASSAHAFNFDHSKKVLFSKELKS